MFKAKEVKKKQISLENKLKTIEDSENGKSLNEICNKYGLSKSTICTIRKQKAQLSAATGALKSRYRIATGEFEIMEDALYGWFVCQSKSHISVGPTQLKCKALKLHKNFYAGSFFASDGWLTKYLILLFFYVFLYFLF